MPNKLCLYCKKPLVPFGNRRRNGGNVKDWDDRKVHRKCFRDWIQYELFMEKIKSNSISQNENKMEKTV
jgi:hypothetical protein